MRNRGLFLNKYLQAYVSNAKIFERERFFDDKNFVNYNQRYNINCSSTTFPFLFRNGSGAVFMVAKPCVMAGNRDRCKKPDRRERRGDNERNPGRGRAFNIRATQRYFSPRGRWTDILNTEGNVKRYLDGD